MEAQYGLEASLFHWIRKVVEDNSLVVIVQNFFYPDINWYDGRYTSGNFIHFCEDILLNQYVAEGNNRKFESLGKFWKYLTVHSQQRRTPHHMFLTVSTYTRAKLSVLMTSHTISHHQFQSRRQLLIKLTWRSHFVILLVRIGLSFRLSIRWRSRRTLLRYSPVTQYWLDLLKW